MTKSAGGYPLEAAALPESVKSLQALNQSGQGLYLFLVPFGHDVFSLLQIVRFTT
ncbi:MAG: hypothetical protein V7L05_09080 [Nostoc sp.]|uniref:hypothetical protein n=1 Tax=Nostoc sp. TaxID=1180 RepID=UPI002FF6853D